MPMKNPPHPGLSVRANCLEPLELTLTEAAKAVGVSRQALNNLIHGQAVISQNENASSMKWRSTCWDKLDKPFERKSRNLRADPQMKIPIFCITCSINGQDVRASAQVMDVRDDGRYEAVCPNGHTMRILLQELKFEILFEIGAYAIYDGYQREAVSSFTSSLERFHEFVIRIILDSSGLADAVISAIWRPISKQSERQLGAFIALYGNAFQKAPPLLSDKHVQFRNGVIHQGVIPNRKEAIQYGQAILDLIRPTMQEIRSKCPKSVNKFLSDHLTACRGDSKDPVSTMGLGTIIGLTNLTPGHDEQSLEEAVGKLTIWKQELGLG